MVAPLEILRAGIKDRALVTAETARITHITWPSGNSVNGRWLFDFRAVILSSTWLNAYAEEFWDRYESQLPFQIAGVETAGIPLVAAIVMKGVARGTPVNGFYVRKSRKREGLMKQIEGTVTNEPVILIDDIVNSGRSIGKVLAVLGDAGLRVRDVFAVMRYRDQSTYETLERDGLQIRALFTLEEFGIPLWRGSTELPRNPLERVWKFSADEPSLEYVIPKSAPISDAHRVYIGSDAGIFYALDKKTGAVAWKFRIGGHPFGKGIFSTPAVHGDTVYFGAYDGYVYALDTATGALRWKNGDAEWIGSSPALAPELGLLYIGVEFGFWKKQGGLIAIDMRTGKRRWIDRTAKFTHGSPLYIKNEQLVVVGSNDGIVYAYDAKNGEQKWQFQSGGDVKASLAYDPKRRLVLFGSYDQRLYAVDARSGAAIFSFETGAIIYSSPLVAGDTVYIGSLDKRLYAIDLDTGKARWSHVTNGRIFASPIISGGSLWIGSNDGILYELDPATGATGVMQQFSERIVNAISYDERERLLFVPTVANELYCLKRP